MSDVKILYMHVNTTDQENFYHPLITDRLFKYLFIEGDPYEIADLGFPQLYSPNSCRSRLEIQISDMSAEAIRGRALLCLDDGKTFSGITHPLRIDYLSLIMKKAILTNAHETTCSSLCIGGETAIIAKLARFRGR